MTSEPTTHREDGWPECPRCEDILQTEATVTSEADDLPPLEELLQKPWYCLGCGWSGRVLSDVESRAARRADDETL